MMERDDLIGHADTLRNAEILVVEDSLTQAKRLERVLRENGFAVRVARDGQAGLDAAREQRPTVIITDVMMPRMDGFELCQHLKTDPALKEVPVVVLTSLSDPRDIIRGLHCGADNFLTKPYGEEYLLRRLRHILTNQELRREGHSQMSVEVFFAGERHFLTADRMQIIDLLLSTFEAAVMQTEQIERLNGETRDAREEAKQLQAEHGGFIKTMWCGELECELKMKEEGGMSSRCMPLKQEHLGDTCPICGKPARKMIYWGIAY